MRLEEKTVITAVAFKEKELNTKVPQGGTLAFQKHAQALAHNARQGTG